ncbi:TonB-dependent receptor [Methylobacterium nodulans]|uniref:TonB-dependent siderophore receptor n=1 Tax=Methylobacterium nodulans (strain LMG 21967 / CNCM I-2342 / ORS 2060) TaxID=460265 RepID=B8IHN8_METNO|nr:TonB-dependent siderophore receptor [Methylobacterium nodulans ORS 2060]
MRRMSCNQALRDHGQVAPVSRKSTDLLTVLVATVALSPLAARAQEAAGGSIQLSEIVVEGAGQGTAPGTAPASVGNPNAVVGPPPPPYAGGQVGSGSRLGFLGNRSTFDQPFSQTSFTDKLIRDQQAHTLQDVVNNDPAVRTNVPAFSGIQGFFIRGFPYFAQDIAFNGLYGVADAFNPALEPIERVEVLHGPSTLLSGIPLFGNIGGTINLIPKRALEVPLTRVTQGYISDGQSYTALDFSRRYGAFNEWGVRFNGAYQFGKTPIDNQQIEFGVAALALDYRGERLRLSADLGYQKTDFNSPLRNRTVAAGFPIPRAPNLRLNQQQPWEYRDSDNKQVALRAEYDLTDQLTVYAAYGHSQFYQEYLGGVLTIFNARGDYRDPISYLPFISNGDTGEVGARGHFYTGPVKHEVGVAAVGLWYDQSAVSYSIGSTITSNLYAPTYFPPRSAFGQTDALPMTAARINRSVAIADTLSVFDGRVQLTIGGRWQGINVKSFNARTGATTAIEDSSAFSPGVGLVVKPIDRLSLYANYIEGLTSPAIPLTAANANQALPAIVSSQVEAGAKYDFGAVGVGFAAYEINQPFGFLGLNNVFALNGEQRNRGVEFSVFGEPAPGFRLLGGFSLIDGRLLKTQGGRFDGNVAVGVPDAQVNLYAEYDLPPWLAPGVTLTGRIIYTSAQYYDQANSQKIPDWATLDLGLRYSTVVQDRPVTFRANVVNVTGNNYWATTGRGILSQGAPRTFLVSATVDF